jgi:4-amino-4-deoxy-L-arabinose transferase-like glycosyltransferase
MVKSDKPGLQRSLPSTIYHLPSAALLAALAAALVLFFVDLGGSSIWDANEAFYVETPREMMERGDYVLPTFNYELRVNKPVLSYWIVAGFYHLFGVSVAVQRIPIAIGGVLLVVVAYFLGWLAFSRQPDVPDYESERRATSHERRATSNERRQAAGLWAALGFAASPRLVMFSRRIFIDIYITLFMAATLLFFALAERYPQRRRLFLVLMYVSVGLGVLTKGPVAAALPGLVFLIYLLVHRELRRAAEMMIPAGIAIVLAIVAPWYVALGQRPNGWDHIKSFFIGENLGRFAEGVGVDQDRGLAFYPGVLFSDGFPWAFLLVAAFALWWRAGARDRIQTLLFLWIGVIVAFFSFSEAKQDLYIYPVMPAVAALGGIAIVSAAPGIRWLSALIGFLFAAAGAGILYVFQASDNFYDLDGIDVFAMLALAGGLTAIILALIGRWREGLVALLAAGVVANWVFVLQVLPGFEKYKPVPRLTQFLEPRIQPDDVIAHYSVALPSMVYYLRRHIDVTYDRGRFVEIMRQDKRVFAILWTQEYESLRNEFGVPTCAIHQTPSFNIKLGAVLRREPLPQLVVISNRCGASP